MLRRRARSSRATLVITAWARPMRATASATRRGLVGVERQRAAGVDEAEAAGPGAAVAEDHERGGAVGPALVDVGAAGLLADRVQVEAAHQVLQLAVLAAEPGPDLHPLRPPSLDLPGDPGLLPAPDEPDGCRARTGPSDLVRFESSRRNRPGG